MALKRESQLVSWLETPTKFSELTWIWAPICGASALKTLHWWGVEGRDVPWWELLAVGLAGAAIGFVVFIVAYIIVVLIAIVIASNIESRRWMKQEQIREIVREEIARANDEAARNE